MAHQDRYYFERDCWITVRSQGDQPSHLTLMESEHYALTKVFVGADINGFAKIINAPIAENIQRTLHPVPIHPGIDTGRIRLQPEISNCGIHKPRIISDGIDLGGTSINNSRRGTAVGECVRSIRTGWIRGGIYVQVRVSSAIIPYYGVFDHR